MPPPARARDAVLVTRPEASGGDTSARIEALGYRAILAPFLIVAPMRAVVPGGIQAVVVASRNALPDLPVLQVPLFAVGDATADSARAHGFTEVHSAGRDADALLELTARLARPEAGPLLLACGRGQSLKLAHGLRARGFGVRRRVFYRADGVRAFPHAAEQALLAGTVHAALFMSAETAASFARLLPASLHGTLHHVRGVAIGKPAADALKHLPWRDLCTARTPTLDGVLTLL